MQARIPNSWFRHVFHQSRHVGFAFVDHVDWKILFCNGHYARMLGYDEKDMIGKHIISFTHDDYAMSHASALERVVAGEDREIDCIVKYITRSQAAITCHIVTIPVKHNGVIRFMVKQAIVIDGKSEKYDSEISGLRIFVKSLEHNLDVLREDMRILMARDTEIRVEGASISSGNTNNSTKIFALITAATIALISAAAYLAYISGWGLHGGNAKPPAHSHTETLK